MKKIWLLPHPTTIFKEDVKALARQHNLKIIDVRFRTSFKADELVAETEAPKLTRVPVKKAKEETK